MTMTDNINKQMQPMTLKPIVNNLDKSNYYIHPALKKDLDGIVATIRNIDDFGTEMGDRNYLLTGQPGTGKTMSVFYLAQEVGDVDIYDCKLINNAQGIMQLFKEAREKAKKKKVFLMINEIDKYSNREDLVDPTQQQTLNLILDELDGADSNHNIFIFGPTNRPEKIDPALRRAKRFSKEIEFLPPDNKGRYEILKIHANGKGGHKFKVDDADQRYISEVTYGFTGADLVGLLNESFTSATLDNKRLMINREDIDYALTKVKPSAIKDMPFIEPKFKFKDIGGYEDHVAMIKRIISNSKGTTALFYGPKGTTKTMTAEAIAGEYGFNYIMINGAALEDKFVGETEKKIDLIFKRAKQLAPCVVLFDELDSFVEKKGVTSHASGWTGVIQSKLSKPIDGVYIIGTMNNPEIMKGPLLDRFIHKMYFAMPTEHEQEAIWRTYLPESLDPKQLVTVNKELSGRDIWKAHMIIKEYGLESSIESYNKIIGGIVADKEEISKYDKIVASIGNSVADYARIKDMLKI